MGFVMHTFGVFEPLAPTLVAAGEATRWRGIPGHLRKSGINLVLIET